MSQLSQLTHRNSLADVLGNLTLWERNRARVIKLHKPTENTEPLRVARKSATRELANPFSPKVEKILSRVVFAYVALAVVGTIINSVMR
ncbi:MAG: hypothetical protein Q7N50_10005 [Armatimonadota bacterium]|nr:hypothetical protein [Armatimonadota bacterium]